MANMKSSEFHDFVLHDLFADIDGITSRRMFGGYGFYRRGLFFALIAEGELYFKVVEDAREFFESRGSHPFIYEARGKRVTMSYWSAPEDAFEDLSLMRECVELACGAAERSK